MSNFESEFSAAKDAIIKAGKAIMSFYEKQNTIYLKGGGNPVTEADFASEKIIIEQLSKFGYGILSEETEDDKSRLTKELVWIIDPLDGTKDFIQKTGEFTVIIGLVQNGQPVLGLVYEPVKNRLFYAATGVGAFTENGKDKKNKLHVSSCEDFQSFKMLVSRNHLLSTESDISKKLRIGTLVQCGSAGLKSSLVALGEADLYLNTSSHTFEWDICAADIIVKEAGGQVTDLEGKTITYNKEDPRNYKGFAVSNGKRHADVIITSTS